MPSKSLARPAALCAGLALILSSAAGFASPPAIPPVATIPVPPLAVAAHAPEPASSPASPSAAAAAPIAAVALAPLPGASAGAPASPEATAAAPPPVAPAPRHIVLVDELPFRATHMRAREEADQPEHAKKRGRHGRPFHPAPGIIVDVVDASGPAGAASAADVQRAARNVGYWPIRHCYEEGLRRDQHLSGKVSLELAVTPGGSVERSSITSATVRDESVVLCVAREAQHLALPTAQSPATARVEVTLSTGDELVPVPHAAPHADDLRDALREAWPSVEQCFASELPRHPDAGGRMELRFRVHPDGTIDEVAEGDTRFGDVDVTRCVLGVYRTSRLPELHHRSHDTTFVYALHFEARPDQNVSPTAK